MTFDPKAPPDGTVRDWLDRRADAETIAFVFPETGDSLTWRDLRQNACRLASHLTGRGVQKGESVAIVMPNGREAVLSLYGALYGGFRATMINLAAGRDAIAYALEHSEARLAFVHDDCLPLFRSAAPDGLQVVSSSEPDGGSPLHEVSARDPALLMYTSGTTGAPKGVVHSHASLLAGGWTTAVAHALTQGDRGFCVLPIYHINGLCVTVMGSLVSGGSIAMVSRFSVSRFWRQVEDARATWFSVVPTIISHLLHSQDNPSSASRERLRFGRSASAALAAETQSAFETRFKVPIIETMGLTETAAQILANPLPPAVRKIGSSGRAFGCRVAIHRDEGTELPRGQEGEIVVRGPNVMSEYLKNPSATADAIRDGWLRTGDLGRMDEDGYVFVTGRLKELIIKGGENIAPREIDEALYAHPDVVEAAAFSRPCSIYGELVEAAVTLRQGSQASSRDLVAFCTERVGKFKAPDAVHILSALPKGPSGKIQRLKLLDLVSGD